jgi:hypothetical protein
MIVCEVCQGPAKVNCSGLDVPRLWFCRKHGAEHAKTCPDIERGAAQMTDPYEHVCHVCRKRTATTEYKHRRVCRRCIDENDRELSGRQHVGKL